MFNVILNLFFSFDKSLFFILSCIVFILLILLLYWVTGDEQESPKTCDCPRYRYTENKNREVEEQELDVKDC